MATMHKWPRVSNADCDAGMWTFVQEGALLSDVHMWYPMCTVPEFPSRLGRSDALRSVAAVDAAVVWTD